MKILMKDPERTVAETARNSKRARSGEEAFRASLRGYERPFLGQTSIERERVAEGC